MRHLRSRVPLSNFTEPAELELYDTIRTIRTVSLVRPVGNHLALKAETTLTHLDHVNPEKSQHGRSNEPNE